MATVAGGTGTAALADVVREEMERWSVPGMALGLLRDGEVETAAFGVASIETGQPVTADTLFQIGSISKVFTTTLITQLVDDGRLDLDAPVVRYLPSFRLGDEAVTGTVTLRHVLTHTGGFYGDRFDDFGIGDDALTKALATFDKLPQQAAPGELWSYCNTGFQVAGAIIERLLETGYEAAVRERIFEPLGMDRSFFFAHEAITYPVAVGHNKLPGKELEIARRYPLTRCMNAAGGIIATAGDLLKFAGLHLGDGMVDGKRVLSQASIQAMQTSQVAAGSFADHYGIGWALRTIDSTRVVGHGGSTNGFRAELTLVPAKRFAMALLTNGSGGRAVNHAVEARALARFAGLHSPEPQPAALPPETLMRLAGRYTRPLADVTISVAGDGLQVDVLQKNPFDNSETTLPPVRAVALAADRFLITEGDSLGETLEFILDESGRVRFLRFHGRLSEPA